MKNLLEWIKNRLGFRNDFKNDYVSDEQKEQLFRVIWRTKDTGWYANETRVWAVSEEDVKRVMMKKYRLKDKDFEEFRVIQNLSRAFH